jgi:hypothetical protein
VLEKPLLYGTTPLCNIPNCGFMTAQNAAHMCRAVARELPRCRKQCCMLLDMLLMLVLLLRFPTLVLQSHDTTAATICCSSRRLFDVLLLHAAAAAAVFCAPCLQKWLAPL